MSDAFSTTLDHPFDHGTLNLLTTFDIDILHGLLE